MKAKYLIQTITNNANMGATGWYSVSGAMTKAQGLDILEDYKQGWGDKQFRLISLKDYQASIREWNRAAFNASKAV
jgi:hypothetical protein